VGAGLLACAVLMANNLRDVEQDRAARKRTLAVLVGPLAGRLLFTIFMLVPFGIVGFFALFYPTALLVLFALLAALPACAIVLWGKTPRELLTALQLASLTALGVRSARVDRGILFLVVGTHDRRLTVPGGVEVARDRLALAAQEDERCTQAEHGGDRGGHPRVHACEEEHGERHGEQQDAQRGVPDPDGDGFHPDSVGRCCWALSQPRDARTRLD